MSSKSEFVEMIAQSIRDGEITINDIVKALIPPKKQKRQLEPKIISEEKKKAQKEYFKQWYNRNKEVVKLRVKANQALKKAPLIATTDLTIPEPIN